MGEVAGRTIMVALNDGSLMGRNIMEVVSAGAGAKVPEKIGGVGVGGWGGMKIYKTKSCIDSIKIVIDTTEHIQLKRKHSNTSKTSDNVSHSDTDTQ